MERRQEQNNMTYSNQNNDLDALSKLGQEEYNANYSNPVLGHLPEDLLLAINVYEKVGLNVTSAPLREAESSDYGACCFGIEGKNIRFRVAKTTPKKIGQFVTIWKRPVWDGDIFPLDSNDGIDFLVVSVSNGTSQGQFVFSRKILIERGIMSNGERKGKLAFRIYPPWTTPTSNSAIKAQQWQLPYFIDITKNTSNTSTNLLLIRLFNQDE